MSGKSLSRPTADAMGMLATVMNALVLEAAIERLGAPARTMSALNMPQVCETYERARALRHFEENRIVVFAGGTGNPFFTTDTTAVLRAAEMECDAVLKATDVDGVYSADPEKGPQGQALRPDLAAGGVRPGPEGVGCHRLRACPGKQYAYHRVLDPEGRARSKRSCAARAARPLSADKRTRARDCVRIGDAGRALRGRAREGLMASAPMTSTNSSAACRARSAC